MQRTALFLLSFLPALLPAQNISSVISGVVQDPTGAVIAGAQIKATSEDKGFVRTSATNTDGFFSFPDLTPATFTLSVNAQGFKNYRQQGIVLNSGEQRDLGIIHLEVGGTADTVTVSAEAVAVNLSSGEKSGSLGAQELDTLALRGRDIFDAVSLMPGVVDTSDGRDAPGPTSIGNIYIAGGRNDQKNMTIDGVTNLDTGSNGSVHSMPSMDSVAELRVLTSNYSAEYGRNSGGTVTVITKGGGRAFHGSGYWFYRHEDLNANDYFNNVAGKPRTPYRYDISGYTIGGPVLLPKIPRDRNKLFFLYSQEFQHKRVAYGTKTVTVPSAAERTGDFSHHLDTNGKVIIINDPLNNKSPFPGNIIPQNRISTVGQNVLKMFPLPNYTDPNPTRVNQWNYFTSVAGAYPSRTESLRLDYQPKNNWQMYVRLNNTADEQHAPYGLWVNGSVNFDMTPIVFGQPGRGATWHSTNTITPTTFNEAIVGVSQNTLTYYPEDPSSLDRTKLGINIPQRNPSLNPLNIIPNMSFGSITNAANPSLSDGVPYFNRNTIYSFVDNLSKIAGTHTLKAGVYLERTRKVQFANASTRGTIKFDRDTTNALDANDAYANALLGNYDTYAEATGRPKGDYRFGNNEFYIQDTWRVKHGLSLDLGVRFVHDPPQYDVKQQLSSFSPSLYNPVNAPVLLRPGFDANKVKVAIDPRNGNIYPSGLIGSFAPNSGDPAVGMYIGGKNGYPAGMYSLPPIAIAPRIGFAWSPFSDRTVIRGGVGVFFDRLEGNPTMNTLPNPPTIFTPTQYYGTIAGIQDQVNSGLLAPTGTVYSLGSVGHNPVTYNYSLNIQHQFGKATIAEVSYVGALNRHQIWQRNINPVPLGANFVSVNPGNKDPTGTGALPANFLRPYQGYGDIFLYEFAGTSNYNSLQASFSQRFKRGITFGAAYTFSKVLDESDSYSSSVDPFYNPRTWNYGPAGFDRTHVFSARYTWQLPKPGRATNFRPLKIVADGWELSGITRLQSGAPFTPTYSLVNGVDFTGSSSASTRPIVVDPNAPVLSRFGPPGYSSVTTPTQGNVGKNVLRGFGTNNWDVSIYRNLNITERLHGQLRFETYNTLNHTQFSGIDGSVKFDATHAQINPLFMQATSARPPRRAQIAVRLNF
ncbi:MAG TPA: carboxypeptidase regulatory-like domain-containing protein [Candidatus Solibacter sp.]